MTQAPRMADLGLAPTSSPEAVVDALFAAYVALGDRGYGEAVSQTEHMLQSAAFAERDGASPALVAAALLHDVGHFLQVEGDDDAAERGVDDGHESIAAAWLSQWFGAAVVRPIALHVDAKRHLCASELGYSETLSPASRLSLRLQGGPMNAADSRAFSAKHFAADALRLRRYDDLGKVRDMAVRPLADYRTLLIDLVRTQASSSTRL